MENVICRANDAHRVTSAHTTRTAMLARSAFDARVSPYFFAVRLGLATVSHRTDSHISAGLAALLILCGCADYDAQLLRSVPTVTPHGCGDGKVGPFELCDTAIATGQPGACPKQCGSSRTCPAPVLVGQACTAQCVQLPSPGASCDPKSSARPEPTAGSPGSAAPADAARGCSSRGECNRPDGKGTKSPSACEEDAGCEMDPGPPPVPVSTTGNGPLHRYSFDGSGTRVRDTISGADGKVVNAELTDDGRLELQRDSGSYVELPADLLSGYDSVTLEFWLTWHGERGARYARIFDFGSSSGPDDAPKVDSTLFLSPNYDVGNRPRLSFAPAGGDPIRLSAPTPFPLEVPAHVAVVLDSAKRTMSLYIDGRVNAIAWDPALGSLQAKTLWLGRSLHADDPGLSASFDEFRIYAAPLSASALQLSRRQGPSTLW